MSEIDNNDTKVSRCQVFGLSSAAIAAATLAVAGGKSVEGQTRFVANHTAPNETDPGPQNLPLAEQLGVGMTMLDSIPKQEVVITPA